MHFTTLAAALALTTAAVVASPAPEVATRATKCIPGAVYCGWYLIDAQGWDAQIMRSDLCTKLGLCDFNSGDAWNSLWHCVDEWLAEPKALCGGKDSCAGPAAHCV